MVKYSSDSCILDRHAQVFSRANFGLVEQMRLLARLFEKSAKVNDDVTFMRTDREFNTLCVTATRNEFAAGAMSLMHSLSRRFWYIHYKQAADMPLTAKLHADIARAIADEDEERAAKATDIIRRVSPAPASLRKR